MGVLTPPYVLFSRQTLNLGGSTPGMICKAFVGDVPTAVIIDSIKFLNTVSNIINITTYILYEVDSSPVNSDYDYTTVNPRTRTEILYDGTLTLNPGDILYAYSDFSSNIFNAFVTGRFLNEITG